MVASRIDLISPGGIGHVGPQFGGSDPATAIGHVHYGAIIRAQRQSDIPHHRAAGTNQRPVAATRQHLAAQPLGLQMIRRQRRTETGDLADHRRHSIGDRIDDDVEEMGRLDFADCLQAWGGCHTLLPSMLGA